MTHNSLPEPIDYNHPTVRQIGEQAQRYVEHGLSLLPIRADGSKMPAVEVLPRIWDEEQERYRRPWGGYRQRQPTVEELRTWYDQNGDECGMAIIGGAVSGNLEIIDCDSWAVAEQWCKLVKAKAPGLLERLVRVKTPRPGLHAYYRCAEIAGSQKLARIPITDPETGKPKPKTIIETKGEGGYCLAPPSPASCHPTGRCYTFIDGPDLSQVPTITPEERQVLLECARQLNCWEDPQRQPYAARPRRVVGENLGRPGDDFNARADWGDILRRHGWKWMGSGGEGLDLWCRPGKGRGTSATTNFGGSDLLYVFSSNAAPFNENKAYNKFSAYALLEHEGDFRAAARTLRAKGYGEARPKSRRRVVAPFERYASYRVRRRNK